MRYLLFALLTLYVVASPAIAGISNPAIDIEKATNGVDADLPPGPIIPLGDPVTWTYFVTNTGDVELVNVRVSDNQGVAVSCLEDRLEPMGSMTCFARGFSIGFQYWNMGTVYAFAPDGTDVSDQDPSHYVPVELMAFSVE